MKEKNVLLPKIDALVVPSFISLGSALDENKAINKRLIQHYTHHYRDGTSFSKDVIELTKI